MGARRHRPARTLAEGGRAWDALLHRARTIWRPRPRLSLRRRRVRRIVAGRRERSRLSHPHRSCRHLSADVRHRGAETGMAAQNGQRRGDRLARHDRTARRQRPQGGPHPGDSRRRRFRHQRPESLHLQRPALRPRRPGDQDRQRRRRQGDHAVSRRVQTRRLQPRPQPRKARHEGAGYVRTVLRKRARARQQHAGRRRDAAFRR